MKLWSSNFVFDAPWKQTTEAVWKKYPNERLPHVRHIDVIDRKVTEDGRLQTTRLFGSTFSFPQLITKLLGLPNMCYAMEYSEVDLKTQKMTLRMINSTFGSVLSVNEKLVYTPTVEDPNTTNLKQSAKIHINSIPFTGYFEDMLVTKFEATSQLGRDVLQNVLKEIAVEQILNTVTVELQQLSQDIDTAFCKFECTFNINEKMAELSKDLDRASVMINSEIQCFSDKLHSELLQLIRKLDNELSEIAVKINLSEHGDDFEVSKTGLFDAVMKAGISAKSDC